MGRGKAKSYGSSESYTFGAKTIYLQNSHSADFYLHLTVWLGSEHLTEHLTTLNSKEKGQTHPRLRNSKSCWDISPFFKKQKKTKQFFESKGSEN